MTPEQRQTLVNVVLAVVVAVAVGTLVMWLRTTVPATTTEGLTVATTDTSPDEVLLCDQLVEDDEIVPVRGRAVSGEVLTCPAAFDGRIVTYVGEVVGDVLRRDDGSWLLVNDDPYALVTGPLAGSATPTGLNSGLAVWVPAPLDERVDTAGRSRLRGDVVEVTGTVRRADPADGGGLTIRAVDLEVVAEAMEVDVPVHWRQIGAAIVLAITALVLTYRDRRRSA